MEEHFIIVVTVHGKKRYLHIDHQLNYKIVEKREEAVIAAGPINCATMMEVTRQKFNVGSVEYERI